MQNYPHHYRVKGTASSDNNASLTADNLPKLESAPPKEFGGPGDKWSPESLLVAAVADCFILSFRAIARASRFEWNFLECEAEGILDKRENITKFYEFRLKATLNMGPGMKHETAKLLLEKAEHFCLITNSLSGDTRLETEIREG